MAVRSPTSDDIAAAARRVPRFAHRTPLIRLEIEDAGPEIYVKLENLQPMGAFKLRPAGNVVGRWLDDGTLPHGVYTASSGNSGLGLAWAARSAGVAARIYVPDGSSPAKLAALARLGAEVIPLPYDAWWRMIVEHGRNDEPGRFFNAVGDPHAMAGNATIGREILEDLPDVDTVAVPFGGGGLASGIAAGLHGQGSNARIVACEPATAAPLTAARAAGRIVEIKAGRSFVDAIGVASVLPEMWPLTQRLIDDVCAVDLEQVAAAIRLLFTRARVVAEGAGAVALAATLAGHTGHGKVVCIVSGGNIAAPAFARILAGGVPEAG